MRIGVVGAGWYGCHLALALKKAGHDVVLYEKNHEIFSGISGKFGIRLHTGPHYPRSAATRESCRRGFTQFINRYPDLVIPHEYSIYGLGATDANGSAPRTDVEHFDKVCKESDNCYEVEPEELGYQGLLSAYDIKEPSIALGKRLRSKFNEYLAKANIRVHCDYDVKKFESKGSKVVISNGTSSEEFDKVINATSYQAHVQKNTDFPFDMEVVYQPCLALIYKDKQSHKQPFSFIVMDGWFPCMMPLIDDDNVDQNEGETPFKKYILTHGKWTIMGSYGTAAEANSVLSQLTNSFIEDKIKPPSENEMKRFWPAFAKRFEYIGWEGTVLAKLRTKKEFRSAVTYEDKSNVIHIIPGKVNNIFDAEDEVFSLLYKENVLERNGYTYVKGGILDESDEEITERPSADEASTTNLRTFEELRRASQVHPTSTNTTVTIDPNQNTQNSQSSGNVSSTNSFFILKCIGGVLACSALLAVAILTLPVTGTINSVIISTAAVIGVGYCGYRLFAHFMNTAPIAPAMEQRPSLA